MNEELETNTPAKRTWAAPTLEEIDYAATEASGPGAVYDGIGYSGTPTP